MPHDEALHKEASARSGFAGNRLLRNEAMRKDETLAAALTDSRTHVLLFAGGHVVAPNGTPVRHRIDALDAFDSEAGPVLLGYEGEVAIVAVRGAERLGADGKPEGLDLRGLALAPPDGVTGADVGALAQAGSLLAWHVSHRFCGRCGTETKPAAAGWRRDCPGCGGSTFPRTDPVVIMMVTHRGPQGVRVLVGRQPRFPPGNYSCLAGFLEPGETVEMAVRREVAEEAGIEVGTVRYHASQPWPMPHSLMLGCYAEALNDAIVPDEDELEDVRWVTRDELIAMRQDTHPEGMRTPPRGTIARLLFDDWLDG